MADIICDELQFEHVKYNIVNRDENIYSSCECFIYSDNEEFVPIANLMRDYGCPTQKDIMPILLNMGFKNEIDRMMLIDVIIGNLDRHSRNYGLIVVPETKEIKRFAPLFDHGNSYMINNHGFLNYPPTGMDFNHTIREMDLNTLRLANKINLERVNDEIKRLPLEDDLKQRIKTELSGRIEKIIRFSEK